MAISHQQPASDLKIQSWKREAENWKPNEVEQASTVRASLATTVFGTSIIEPKVEVVNRLITVESEIIIHSSEHMFTDMWLNLSMDNIVGSQIGISKYWTKSWIKNKQNLVLTKKQFSLIIGSMLGDGTMRVGQGAVNANFKVEHGLEQKDLVFWKYKILEPWVFTPPKLSYRYHENGDKYLKSWWFRTVRHPILTRIHRSFYKNGIKIVPNDLIDYLDELAIACWVMDDGCYRKSNIDISTYSFTLIEIEKLLGIFRDKFTIDGNYYRDRNKGYRIYFNVNETEELIEIIEPFVIGSMRYKIGYSKFDPVKTSRNLRGIQQCNRVV